MEADVSGPQRKVKVSWARPAKAVHGTEGITVRDGRTLPFVVHREWLAPAGTYQEQWFLIDPETREVLYEGKVSQRAIRGLQALTACEDVVTEPLALTPGSYRLVFALGGLQGGEMDVAVAEAPAEAA